MINAGFSILSQMSEPQKVSFLAFWYLSNVYLEHEPDQRLHTAKELELLNKPSVESLIAQAVLGGDTEWTETDHRTQLERYYTQRYRPTGIKVPANVEACMGLSLAERYRRAGASTMAMVALSSAAEDFPHLKQLRSLSAEYDPDTPITWLSIIYPRIADQRATLECHGL